LLSTGYEPYVSYQSRARRFRRDAGLELTLPQAVRLWNVAADDCRVVLDALTDSGFLKWTHRRTVIRTGQEPSYGFDRDMSYVLVHKVSARNKSG
jgi:hypothetical protein